MRAYEGVREEQRRVQADVDLNVLKRARLVGMTTAGVASKQDLVAAMAPKVFTANPIPATPIWMLMANPCMVLDGIKGLKR